MRKANKIFPPMESMPEKGQIIALIPCWIWVFVLFPMFMPILGLGLWDQSEMSVWLDIGYHTANGVVLLLLIRSYLQEEWFMVSVDWRYYLKHVALTVGLILGTEFVWMSTLFFYWVNIDYMLESLPVVGMFVSHSPFLVADLEPLFGTISLSVFAPISVCALFYYGCFAPICGKKPWLAYLSVAIITLIPPVINILWRGDAAFVLCGYLAHLPVHLLACWSYQKTNNAWTPLISLAIVNFLISIVFPIVLFR